MKAVSTTSEPKFLVQIVEFSAALMFSVALMLSAAPGELSGQGPKDLQISAGLGLSFSPTDHAGHSDAGVSVLVEHVFAPAVWGGGQVYVGGVFTDSDPWTCSTGVEPCAVSSSIGVAGAKVRALAPIPWVGPFFEVGLGFSVGSIETRLGRGPSLFGLLPPVMESHSGIMLHIPVTVGLAVGRRHQHEVSFAYYVHPGREHVAGAVQVGMGFAWR